MFTSSNDTMAAKAAPAATPGPMSGSVMARNVRQGVSPRLMAARSRLGSSPARPAPTRRITYGTVMTRWPHTRLAGVRVIPTSA